MPKFSAILNNLWGDIHTIMGHYDSRIGHVNLKPNEVKQYAGLAYQNLEETIKYLKDIKGVMEKLYENPEYQLTPKDLQEVELFLARFNPK